MSLPLVGSNRTLLTMFPVLGLAGMRGTRPGLKYVLKSFAVKDVRRKIRQGRNLMLPKRRYFFAALRGGNFEILFRRRAAPRELFYGTARRREGFFTAINFCFL